MVALDAYFVVIDPNQKVSITSFQALREVKPLDQSNIAKVRFFCFLVHLCLLLLGHVWLHGECIIVSGDHSVRLEHETVLGIRGEVFGLLLGILVGGCGVLFCWIGFLAIFRSLCQDFLNLQWVE